MAKYRIETDKGTYEVETDEGANPAIPSAIKPKQTGFEAPQLPGSGMLHDAAQGVVNFANAGANAGIKHLATLGAAVLPEDFGGKVSREVAASIPDPTSPAEKAGAFTEGVAEYAAPGGAVSKLTKGTPLIVRAGAQGAVNAAVAKGQGGSAATGAVLGAAGELIPAAVGGVKALSAAKPQNLENYSTAFAAVPTQKTVIGRALPTLIKDGVQPGSNPLEMQGVVKSRLGDLGKDYEALPADIGSRTIDPNKVIADLQLQQAKFSRNGVVTSANKPYFDKIQAEIEDVKNLSKANASVHPAGSSKFGITPDVAKGIVEDNEEIPDGWFVHGRSGSGELSNNWPTQLTSDPHVANGYAGNNGSVWLIKKNAGTRVADFTSDYSSDMDSFIKSLKSKFSTGSPSIEAYRDALADKLGKPPGEVKFGEFEDAVRDEFTPSKIVDSARAFDDPLSINLLEHYPGGWPHMIETPDGAVVMPGAHGNVDSVNITKTAAEKPVATGGQLSFDDLKHLRDGANGRTNFASPDADINMFKDVGNVYRKSMDAIAPETTQLNRDYATYKSLEGVVDKNVSYGRGVVESGLDKAIRKGADRAVGAGLGAGIGAATGIPGASWAGGIIGGTLYPKISEPVAQAIKNSVANGSFVALSKGTQMAVKAAAQVGDNKTVMRLLGGSLKTSVNSGSLSQ